MPAVPIFAWANYAASGALLSRPLRVVEPYPVFNDLLGLETVIGFMQIDAVGAWPRRPAPSCYRAALQEPQSL